MGVVSWQMPFVHVLFLVWPFRGRLAGVSHHLKCLALVIYGYSGYAGHLATDSKWLPFQLI